MANTVSQQAFYNSEYFASARRKWCERFLIQEPSGDYIFGWTESGVIYRTDNKHSALSHRDASSARLRIDRLGINAVVVEDY